MFFDKILLPMENMRSFKPVKSALFILLFVSFKPMLFSQNVTDFTGKWAFDLSKSDLGEGSKYWSGEEILDIIQDAYSINIIKTSIIPGSENISKTDVYKFDGKELILKEDFGTTKENISWAKDGKALIINTLTTTSTREYLIIDSYSLSQDSKTLTITTYSKNSATGESTLKMVYNRK